MSDIAARDAELRQMLIDRRRALQEEVHTRLRNGRTDRPNDVHDELEHSDHAMQDELELALIQMRAATLARIDQALIRLAAGKYGSCFECGDDIAERRLRALPFAVRCQGCEGRREQELGRQRKLAQRRDAASPFSSSFGS